MTTDHFNKRSRYLWHIPVTSCNLQHVILLVVQRCKSAAEQSDIGEGDTRDSVNLLSAADSQEQQETTLSTGQSCFNNLLGLLTINIIIVCRHGNC